MQVNYIRVVCYIISFCTLSRSLYLIWYDIFFNCSWVDTLWQQYSTHLHTNNTQNDTMNQNTQNGTYVTKRIHKHNNKNM